MNCVNGICEPVSPAPATSPSGLVAILIVLGGLGLWRLRRGQR
jgi:MYXO-CTERM domain-containing protein